MMGTSESEASFEGEPRKKAQISPEQIEFNAQQTKGDKHMTKMNWDRACDAYTKALQIKENALDVLLSRSRCYVGMGQADKALADAEAAQKIDNHSYKVIFAKAEALYAGGMFEMALVLFHRGHKLRPDDARFDRGVIKCQDAIKSTLPEQERPLPDTASTTTTPEEGPQRPDDVPPLDLSSTQLNTTAGARLTTGRKTERELLGDLYKDKEFLEELMADPVIAELASSGVNFLNNRAAFWRARGASLAPSDPRLNTPAVAMGLTSSARSSRSSRGSAPSHSANRATRTQTTATTTANTGSNTSPPEQRLSSSGGRSTSGSRTVSREAARNQRALSGSLRRTNAVLSDDLAHVDKTFENIEQALEMHDFKMAAEFFTDLKGRLPTLNLQQKTDFLTAKTHLYGGRAYAGLEKWGEGASALTAAWECLNKGEEGESTLSDSQREPKVRVLETNIGSSGTHSPTLKELVLALLIECCCCDGQKTKAFDWGTTLLQLLENTPLTELDLVMKTNLDLVKKCAEETQEQTDAGGKEEAEAFLKEFSSFESKS